MNILFLSVYEIEDSGSGYIYADLIREFERHGHNIYAVTPTRIGSTEIYTDSNGINIIKVRNGQIQKTGRIKKVLNLLALERNTVKAVNKFVANVKFDLVINMTSNLSYFKAMKYFKKRDGAVAYLLLKDIFPQNAVDIGMLNARGIMSPVYRHFKNKEKKMYRVADRIGCMSEKNREYVIKHNAFIDEKNVTVIPNSIEPIDVLLTAEERAEMREKYDIPRDKTVFVYGGNLGKPQDIPFIIDCLKTQSENSGAFFLIVGDGTEYRSLAEYASVSKQSNLKVLKRLPRGDFDAMLAACDVGMIFLDHRFTVPNYPSRLLSYMQAGIPVLACTDPNTDVGIDLENGGFGWRCDSGDVSSFVNKMDVIMTSDLKTAGDKAKSYLTDKFSVSKSYNDIMATVGK